MNPASLKDRSAVVTGSTRGIGEATARRLAEAGASVVVSGRTEDDGRRVAKEITEEGEEAIFVRADMREPDEVENLVETTVEEFGGLDILVNNAGYETDTSPDEVDMETWNGVVETNFRGYWLTAKYAYPYLVESDSAAVVNVSSNHSFATQPKKFPYNAVKAGLDGMTRSMAVAWGVDGIRVNSVNPGWTLVGRVEETLTDEEMSELESIHPLGRIGSSEDVADTILYLASDMASFVTGESHVVDGGRTAVLQDDLYLKDFDM